MSNSSGPHRRASRSRSSVPLADHVHLASMNVSRSVSPPRTRTGRISRALKGLKVHGCRQCGKVYSRAEHLRRHQFNHQSAPLRCHRCNRNFFREDLLTRHYAKYHKDASDIQNLSGPDTISSVSPTPIGHSPSATDSISQSIETTIGSPMTKFPSPTRYSNVSFVNVEEPFTSSYLDSYPFSNLPAIPADISRSPFHPQDNTTWATVPVATNYPLQAPVVTGVPQPCFAPYAPVPFQPVSFMDIGPMESFSHYPDWPTQMHNTLQSPNSTTPSLFDLPQMDPDRASFKTSSSSSPAPMSAVPPVFLPLSSSNQDDSLHSSLGIHLGPSRSQGYLDSYWKNFHPLFPILHNHRFKRAADDPNSKLLAAATMAIGAQYSHHTFSGSDCRLLHEKLQDRITRYKDILVESDSLELMQAVVLVEYLSHFKAKRAPEDLSEGFRTVYDKLLHSHMRSQTGGRLGLMSGTGSTSSGTASVNIAHHYGGEESANQTQWDDWIEHHSRERLLSTCYILDSRHALLLGRRNHHANAAIGMDLCVPAPQALWEATSATRWMQLLRASNTAAQITTVQRLLDNILNSPMASSSSSVGTPMCDAFQSALIVANYSASCASSTSTSSSSSQSSAPPSHPLFTPTHLPALSRALAGHPSVQIMFRAVQLISKVPFRALIATASESWFFSRKLASDANSAMDEFKRLKVDLREWTNAAPPPPSSSPSSTVAGGSATAQDIGQSSSRSGPVAPFFEATELALDIVRIAVSSQSPHLTLSFGPELALYTSSLVLWAAAFAGLNENNPLESGEEHAPPAEWEPLRAERLVREFVPVAVADVRRAVQTARVMNDLQLRQAQQWSLPAGMPGPSSAAVAAAFVIGGHQHQQTVVPSQTHVAGTPATVAQFPPGDVMDSWVTGVGSVIRWTAWVLGGSGHRNSGAGELIEGTIGVLEKLGRMGWVQAWF